MSFAQTLQQPQASSVYNPEVQQEGRSQGEVPQMQDRATHRQGNRDTKSREDSSARGRGDILANRYHVIYSVTSVLQ